MRRDNYYVFGGDTLCCWQVAPRTSWIQTRRPAIANVLRQRSDCRLVLWSVEGPYLRTFEMAAPLKLAIRFVRRHQTKITAPNDPISSQRCPPAMRKPAARVCQGCECG